MHFNLEKEIFVSRDATDIDFPLNLLLFSQAYQKVNEREEKLITNANPYDNFMLI